MPADLPADSASVTIRVGTPADAASLADFARRVFVDAFGADNNPDDLALYLAQAFGEAQQHAELADAARCYLLAEMEGALAGYALLNRDAGHALVPAARPVELQRFYLDRAWRGQGLAAVLLARAMTVARGWGADVLWLGSWERNPRGLRFYAKHGFRDVGSHVFVVGTDPQTDRILMRAL